MDAAEFNLRNLQQRRDEAFRRLENGRFGQIGCRAGALSTASLAGIEGYAASRNDATAHIAALMIAGAASYAFHRAQRFFQSEVLWRELAAVDLERQIDRQCGLHPELDD